MHACVRACGRARVCVLASVRALAASHAREGGVLRSARSHGPAKAPVSPCRVLSASPSSRAPRGRLDGRKRDHLSNPRMFSPRAAWPQHKPFLRWCGCRADSGAACMGALAGRRWCVPGRRLPLCPHPSCTAGRRTGSICASAQHRGIGRGR
eukprot:363403-Chlamydomonas_euryale.AAC.13